MWLKTEDRLSLHSQSDSKGWGGCFEVSFQEGKGFALMYRGSMFFIQVSWCGFLAFHREQTGPLSWALQRSEWWWKYGSLSQSSVGWDSQTREQRLKWVSTYLCAISAFESDVLTSSQSRRWNSSCGHCSPCRAVEGFIGALLKYGPWAAAGMVAPGTHRLEVGITEKEKYWGVKNIIMFQLWWHWAVGGLQRTSAGFQASFIKRWINYTCPPWNKKKGGYKRKLDEVQAILK